MLGLGSRKRLLIVLDHGFLLLKGNATVTLAIIALPSYSVTRGLIGCTGQTSECIRNFFFVLFFDANPREPH
jgi:hypothetical protein